MKQIKQFRYYGSLSKKNYPATLTYGDLYSGNIFKNLGLVSHLGIQASPGTTFYLNGNKNSIQVGSTGIYELDLEGIGQIFSIQFSKNSLEEVGSSEEGILIDVVYEGGGNLS